jgi:restriction endonuclease S subunit
MRDVPTGWRSIQLRDAGKWLTGGTPSTDDPRYWGGEVPWISAASLNNFRLRDSQRRITLLGTRSGTQLVPAGAVIFVVRGMSLKKEFRVGVTQRQVAFGQDCRAIVPPSTIDGTFLALAIKARTNEILGMVDEAGHGTGRLPTDLISRLKVPIPPIREQQRIAEILDALDDQIRTAEHLINKMSALHIGLINRLIESTLGTQTALAEVASRVAGSTVIGPFGSDLVVGDYRSSGVPVVFVRDIRESGFCWVSDVYVDRTKARALSAHGVRPGDLLLTKMGFPPCIAAVYPTSMPEGIITADVIRIRPDLSRVDPYWLGHAINHERFRRQVRAITGGVTRPKVTLGDVRRLTVDLPSLRQQRKIGAVINTTRDTLSAAGRVHESLLQLRQGLMDDLLTGRVRVPVGDDHRG